MRYYNEKQNRKNLNLNMQSQELHHHSQIKITAAVSEKGLYI